jgi:CubicO group peptidase (beta-lactamase class C family)
VFERYEVPAIANDNVAASFVASGETQPWETNNASEKVDMARLTKVVEEHFADTRLHARAVLLVVDGKVVMERYGDGCDKSTRLLGWSATKTILNALIGIRVKQGEISLDTTAGELLSAWQSKIEEECVVDDCKALAATVGALGNTTIKQMLQMSDGFNLDEFYFPSYPPTNMLFSEAGE